MSVFHVKTTGTRGGANGASTPDVWTNANCFSTLRLAFNQSGTTNADGDEFILDDEAHTGDLLDSVQSNKLVNAGTYTIKSRGGDYNNCSFGRGEASIQNIQMDTAGIHLVVENIFLTRPLPTTQNATGMIIDCTVQANLTLTNCPLDGCTFAASGAMNRGILINYQPDAAATLTINNPIINGNISTATRDVGLIYAGANATTITTGIGILSNNTLTQNNGTDGFGRIITTDGPATLGDFIVYGNTLSHYNRYYGLICCHSTTDAATVGAVVGYNNNFTLTGPDGTGTIMGTLVSYFGPFIVDSITQYNVTSTGFAVDQSSPTTALLGYGNSAVGTCKYIEVYDCTGHHGVTFHNSQGATMTVNRVISHDNTAESGPGPRSGGWGDLTVHSALIYNNIATGKGGAGHFIQHTDATRDKVVTINQLTAFNNIDTGDEFANGLNCRTDASNAAGYSFTININNAILLNSQNGAAKELRCAASGSAHADATIVANLDYCHIGVNGTEAADAKSTVNVTNEQTSDPLLTSNYTLAANSPAKRLGRFLSYDARDVRGHRRRIPPSLGAYEPILADARTFATSR